MKIRAQMSAPSAPARTAELPDEHTPGIRYPLMGAGRATATCAKPRTRETWSSPSGKEEAKNAAQMMIRKINSNNKRERSGNDLKKRSLFCFLTIFLPAHHFFCDDKEHNGRDRLSDTYEHMHRDHGLHGRTKGVRP